MQGHKQAGFLAESPPLLPRSSRQICTAAASFTTMPTAALPPAPVPQWVIAAVLSMTAGGGAFLRARRHRHVACRVTAVALR